VKILGISLAVLLVGATAAVVAYDRFFGSETVRVAPKGNSSLSAARAFQRYPLYFPGHRVDDLRLTAVDRQVGPGLVADERGADTWMFGYGSCEARSRGFDGGSCTLPLVVQIWPSCFRQGYPMAPDESLTVRGTEAVFYEGGGRLEIATGPVTIVMFGHRRELILRAARALRGVNNSLRETERLPPPTPVAC
jgi:hypothetical protein